MPRKPAPKKKPARKPTPPPVVKRTRRSRAKPPAPPIEVAVVPVLEESPQQTPAVDTPRRRPWNFWNWLRGRTTEEV